MKFLTIQSNENTLRCSSLGLGTAKFGVSELISDEQCFALLDRFAACGGTLLDTACVYAQDGNGRSRSEILLGKWLKSRKDICGSMVVVTKGGHYDLADPQRKARLSEKDLAYDLDLSLENLQTDCIDLYLLHRDDPTLPVEEIIDTLNRFVRAGKIRCIGASNWTFERISEANAYAMRSNQLGFCVSEVGFSLRPGDNGCSGDPTIPPFDDSEFQKYAGSGIALFAYNAQASGFFSRNFHRPDVDIHAPAPLMQRLHALRRVCAESDLLCEQAVLGYLTSQSIPTAALFSASTMEHLDAALTASDTQLTEKQLRILKQSCGKRTYSS